MSTSKHNFLLPRLTGKQWISSIVIITSEFKIVVSTSRAIIAAPETMLSIIKQCQYVYTHNYYDNKGSGNGDKKYHAVKTAAAAVQLCQCNGYAHIKAHAVLQMGMSNAANSAIEMDPGGSGDYDGNGV